MRNCAGSGEISSTVISKLSVSVSPLSSVTATSMVTVSLVGMSEGAS